MGGEGALSPAHLKRKRSPTEPGASGSELGTKRRATSDPNKECGKKMPQTNFDIYHTGPSDALSDTFTSGSTFDEASGEAALTPASGTGQLACVYCEKRFRSPGKLAQHERVHARDELPYYCSFCPKRFRYQSQATEHERSHTGEKPHACSMCPRRFAQKSKVAPHERTHTGKKPYACSMCPARFARKDYVALHERTHTTD